MTSATAAGKVYRDSKGKYMYTDTIFLRGDLRRAATVGRLIDQLTDRRLIGNNFNKSFYFFLGGGI